jgi:hypothetical protein
MKIVKYILLIIPIILAFYAGLHFSENVKNSLFLFFVGLMGVIFFIFKTNINEQK